MGRMMWAAVMFLDRWAELIKIVALALIVPAILSLPFLAIAALVKYILG